MFMCEYAFSHILGAKYLKYSGTTMSEMFVCDALTHIGSQHWSQPCSQHWSQSWSHPWSVLVTAWSQSWSQPWSQSWSQPGHSVHRYPAPPEEPSGPCLWRRSSWRRGWRQKTCGPVVCAECWRWAVGPAPRPSTASSLRKTWHEHRKPRHQCPATHVTS